MLKVQLRTEKLNIRCKQLLMVSIKVKKDQSSFIIPGSVPLCNCEAIMNLISEFYIPKNDPTFQLQVILVLGQIKKLAGKCTIDLGPYSKGSLYKFTRNLDNSPDSNALFTFGLKFQENDQANTTNKLLSSFQFQSNKKEKIIKQLQNQTLLELNKNNNLIKQIQKLNQQNQYLAMCMKQACKQLQFSLRKMCDQYNSYTQKQEYIRRELQKCTKIRTQILQFVIPYQNTPLGYRIQNQIKQSTIKI